MIEVKSNSELEIMKSNADLLDDILSSVVSEIEPGVTTKYLDDYSEDLIKQAGATPAFKDYRGFPNCLCTSINEEIVHGIPGERQIDSGDVLSLDLGLQKDGFFADFATTVPVGEVGDDVMDLISVANCALTKGLAQVIPENRIGDVSHAIGSFVEENGFFVVKEFVGHGIGRKMHEDPQVPNYGEPGTGKRIKEGMVLCIEPMVKQDDKNVEILDDGWTAVSADRGITAHFEGMVVARSDGPEVLVRGGTN